LHKCISTTFTWARHIHCVSAALEGKEMRQGFKVNIQGSVHRKYILIYIQQDATLHILFISRNCSTCFGWYLRPSSGAHTTVSTASGTCQTVTATCICHGRDGTSISICSIQLCFCLSQLIKFEAGLPVLSRRCFFKQCDGRNAFATLTLVVSDRFHARFVCLGYKHPLFKSKCLKL